MNTKQQKLLDRLKDALGEISKSPETAAEVTLIFEEMVISFEEIASDLKTESDEETATALKTIVQATAGSGTNPTSAGPLAMTI